MVLPWEFLRVEHPVDVICRVNLQTAEVRAIAAQLVIEVFLNTADEPFSRNDVNCCRKQRVRELVAIQRSPS